MSEVPFRLRFHRRLTECLESISTADGYHNDMAGRVYRGRATFGANEEAPIIAITETMPDRDSGDQRSARSKSNTIWNVLITGFAEDAPVNPTDPAYYLLADIQRKLAEEIDQAGGMAPFGFVRGIHKVELGPSLVRPPDETVSATAFCWQALTIHVVENHADPYA